MQRRRSSGEAESEGSSGLKTVLPLSLAALGVGRLLSGNAPAPQWYDCFWFAFSTHHMLNRRSGGQA